MSDSSLSEDVSSPVTELSAKGSDPASIEGREVGVGIRVYAIQKLSTTDETFELDVRIFFTWIAEPDWNFEPKLGENVYVSNAEEFTIIDEPPAKMKGAANQMRKNMRVHLKLRGNFELRQFPFDKQQLPITVRIPRVERQGISKVSADETLCEFRHGPNEGVLASWSFKSIEGEVKYSAPGEANFKPDYVAVITIQRQPYYFLVNVCGPIALLTLLNFSVYFVEQDAISDRMSIVLTVLLTLIAFKFSISAILPVLGYETYLEEYTLVLSLLVVFSGIESMAICKVPLPVAQWIDLTFAGLSFLIYITHHALWLHCLIMSYSS